MRQKHITLQACSNRESLGRASALLLRATISIILSACGGGGGDTPQQPMDSGSAVLRWDPVTAPNLAGYHVHYGTMSGNYSEVVDVGLVTTFEVTSLKRGTSYYFAATAYDASGNSSFYSNEVIKDIP